jgi:hypothetical protein
LFSLSALLSTRASAAIIAFPVATNTATIEIPTAAAFDGTNYLAGLVSGTNVGVQLILPTGSLSGSFVNVGRSSNGPALAFDGTNYLAAWSDQFVASGATMFGQFITRSGATNGPVFPLLLNTAVHGFQRIQALAFGRTNYLAVWQDANNSSLYGQFINRSGSLVGSEFSIFAQRCGAVPGLAFDGTNFFVVFHSQNPGTGQPWNLYGQFISTNGTVGPFVFVSQTTSLRDNPAGLAFDGTNYLAFWNHNSGFVTPSVFNIYARTITRNGGLPGGEMNLTVGSVSQYFPSIAFDGANHLLCWTENLGTINSQIKYQFLNPAAQPVGAGFTVFKAQGTNPPVFGAVLFDGKQFFAGAVQGLLDTNTLQFVSGDVYGAFIPASTAKPRLDPVAPFTNTQFKVRLSGTPGMTYAIQAATNLVSTNISWTNLTTVVVTNGTFDYLDTAVTNRNKIYRAVKQ